MNMIRQRIESFLPLPLRDLSLVRVRRALRNPPRRMLVWWRHRNDSGVRLLVNSTPKSGTYLLNRCFDLSGEFEPFHRGVYIYGTKGKRGILARKSDLARLGGGVYVQAHLPCSHQAELILEELAYKHVLSLRDPRDIAVSRYRFEASHKYLPFYDLFANLPNPDARLRTSIIGSEKYNFDDIGSRVRSYLGWLQNNCCVVRFENLIGPQGGGSRAAQEAELRRIYAYLEIAITDQQIEQIAERLYTRRARTFRNGRIGDWRNHFTEEHKELFKQFAGDLLIQLGYEQDDSW